VYTAFVPATAVCQCEDHILSLFPLDFARNPAALLVWRTKDLFAKVNEIQRAKIDFSASKAEEDQENPFVLLSKTL